MFPVEWLKHSHKMIKALFFKNESNITQERLDEMSWLSFRLPLNRSETHPWMWYVINQCFTFSVWKKISFISKLKECYLLSESVKIKCNDRKVLTTINKETLTLTLLHSLTSCYCLKQGYVMLMKVCEWYYV